MDAANVDLKAFTERFYRKVCGGASAGARHARLPQARDRVWFEVTTLLIPARTTKRPSSKRSRLVHGNLGPDVPLHFTAFHPD